eukprot:1159888-Pelagomonas_calceolata.AAC.2
MAGQESREEGRGTEGWSMQGVECWGGPRRRRVFCGGVVGAMSKAVEHRLGQAEGEPVVVGR